MLRHVLAGPAAISLLAVLAATPAASEGALAIGSTGNIVKDGIAYGSAYNFPTREEAARAALEQCRKWNAPKAAANCQVVATFRRECYAVANDPKAGTPGTGWAIGPSKETADARALAGCKSVAGKDRERFCVVDQSNCDARD